MHPTSKFYNYLVSYTINVLALLLFTILYYQFRRFTTLYYLIQSTSKFYNSLLSHTPNFDVLQLSSILYNKLHSFTPPYYLILAISKIYNSLLSYITNFDDLHSLLSYTINFDVLQLSTILYNQLRSFTIQSNLLLSYTPTLYYLIHTNFVNVLSTLASLTILYYQYDLHSLLSYTINFVLQLSTILYNQHRSYNSILRRFTTLYYLIQSTS